MRFSYLCLAVLVAAPAYAAAGKTDVPADTAGQIEVTADQSLEWYQDAHIYVARGNAKAVRGDMVVEADILTAHEREKPAAGVKKKTTRTTGESGANGSGDLDKLTAEGHVRITNAQQRITGDHAVDDIANHVAVVTGGDLKYETEKETVTAKQSLEYWEDKKLAVARGHAVATSAGRHIEADVLTAEFRDAPNGEQQLWKMTATGNVTVITKDDVARGDRAVYDVARDIAVLSGNVRITRNDGTQLTGDVGETDFKSNRSRLLNEGHGRVRALLTSKTTGKVAGSNSGDKTIR